MTGTSYLELTNKVLRKLNEVELTSANFASATGFHALVKDAVNYAINDINQDEKARYRWPWNYHSGSQTLTAETTEYSLPTGTKAVDWKTFFLSKDDTLGVSPSPIKYIDYVEYNNRLKAADLLMDSTSVNLPEWVFRTSDDKFGISPLPDRAYTVTFKYWGVDDQLSAHSDTTSIYPEYDKVIVSGAVGHAYDFRENFEMAGKEYSIFEKGVKRMRGLEISTNNDYAFDTRTSRRSNNQNNWAK